MTPPHPLAYVLLGRDFYSVPPTPSRWRHATYPHVDDNYLSHFLTGHQTVSLLLNLYNHPPPCPLITKAAWSGIVTQGKPQEILPFCAETGFCVGVSHNMMLRLCQQHKHWEHTSYKVTIRQELLYPHGGQRQTRFTLHREPPLFPVSGHPSLQWDTLPLIPLPHVFWIRCSL